MKFRIVYWCIVLSYGITLVQDAAVATEECYISDIQEKVMCFNVKGSIINNETHANSNVTQLALFKTQLSVMKASFFEKFSACAKLTTLTMSHGDLSEIAEHGFALLKELNHLNLSFNKISEISEKAFVDNVNLKSISLMSNEIKDLKVDTFSTLVDLESVDLTRNSLSALNKHLFLDNVNLIRLDVKFNELKEMSGVMFHALPALESLDLSYNQIEAIPPHAFKYNYALSKLNLQGNRIERVDYAFAHLGLSQLNLLDNPLDMDDEKTRHAITYLETTNVVLKVVNHKADSELEVETKNGNTSGGVMLRTSPQLKLTLVGIVIFLAIIIVLLGLLLRHVHRRNKKMLHRQYYHSSCKSVDNLQADEQTCLRLGVSEGSVLFQNCHVNTDETRSYSGSCITENTDHKINKQHLDT